MFRTLAALRKAPLGRRVVIATCVLATALGAAGCDKDSPSPQGEPAPRGLPPVGQGRPLAEPTPGVVTGAPPVAVPPGATTHPGAAAPHGGAAAPGADRSAGSRADDASRILSGTIEIAPALAARVKPGDVIFLSAKPVDASGAVGRVPLAVDRLEVGSLPMPFRLGSEHVMMTGTQLAGNVLLTARVDRDGDAMTRTAGDVEGTLRATVPATGLQLVLDIAVP